MSTAPPGGPIPLTIHGPEPSVAGLCAGLDPGALRAPLEDVLAGLCQRMSGLIESDVVSVYARERSADGDDLLVIRGNVGLAAEVVGNLELRVGDGIVGWVAECMHAISVTAADRDPRFKAIRGIGEELFPVMLAQPLVRAGRCLGVLVLQRSRAHDFSAADMRMAAVLADMAALVLEADGRGGRAGDVSTEAVCLLGRSLSSGLGIGRVELIPTAESLASRSGPPPRPAQVGEALARIERDLTRLRGQLGSAPDAAVAGALDRMELLLSDRRLRERLTSEEARLSSLARDYARAPLVLAGGVRPPDRVMRERAEEVGELCALLEVLSTGGRLLQSGRVWIGRRLGAFFALAAARTAAAVVLDGDGEATPDAVAIAKAAGMPLLAGARGLFAWTQPGDLLVVDADRAVVRINPSSSGVLAARSAGRERRARAGGGHAGQD